MMFIGFPIPLDLQIYNLITLELLNTIGNLIQSQKWEIQSTFKTAGLSTIYTTNLIKMKGKIHF